MRYEKVAFVGGGNMTRAIAGGLLDDGYAASDISISEPLEKQREVLRKNLPGIHISGDNADVVNRAGSVVLAVKPQVLADVCKQLAGAVQASQPLIISIAAGIRSIDIESWLGGGLAVVRVMPNQPALLRQGITGIFANDATTSEQFAAASKIMSAVGSVVAVPDENDIDAVTVISGSGPAYFYLLIDMLATTGRKLGLDDAAARQLAAVTAKGAAMLALGSDEAMETLIAKVRSPGGTTAAALDSLEDQGIRDIFDRALRAAHDRAVELADQAHVSGQD